MLLEQLGPLRGAADLRSDPHRPPGGYDFVRDNEIHYELARSEDEEFAFVEGALQSQRPCTACQTTPGQYSNSVENFYDHARDWMNRRFRAD